jgi:hypothetical protein
VFYIWLIITFKIFLIMKPEDHKSDINNANDGAPGTNTTYQHRLDNRSEQLNKQSPKFGGGKSKK